MFFATSLVWLLVVATSAAPAVEVLHESCAGSQVRVIAPSTAARFRWADGAVLSTPERQGLLAGRHEVEVLDAHGAGLGRAQVRLRMGFSLALRPQCRGGAASATVLDVVVPAAGDPLALTFSWSTGATTQSIPLDARVGEYHVTATDTHTKCSRTASFNASSSAQRLGVSVAVTNVPCADQSRLGSVTATATGGASGALRYEWAYRPDEQRPFSPLHTAAANSNTVSGSAGWYRCTVRDSADCVATAEGRVQAPPELSAVARQVMEPGKPCVVAIFAEGGLPPYFYTWSVLDVGCRLPSNWGVTVTDQNQCAAVVSVLSVEIFVNLTARDEPSCAGDARVGSLHIQAVGGMSPFTFSWNYTDADGKVVVAPDLVKVPPGAYQVNVTDSIGRRGSAVFTIYNPKLLEAQLRVQPTSCFGAGDSAITAVVAGGLPPYSFDWTGTASVFGATGPTIKPADSGRYQLVVRDAKGCTSSAHGWVPAEPEPLTVALYASPARCPDVHSCPHTASGSVATLVLGGVAPYRYRWTSPNWPARSWRSSRQLHRVGPGVYELVVADAHNCTQSQQVTLSAEAVGWTPLHDAAMRGDLQMTQWLVDKGAPVNCIDEHGMSPLHLAVRYGMRDVARFLLSQHADVHTVSNSGPHSRGTAGNEL